MATKAEQLRALHHLDVPLVLANVWDVASARIVARAGSAALATSSGAVAASLGYEDDDSMPVEAAFGVVKRIAAAVDLPVTADVEAGYQLGAADLTRRLLRAGAVGCNLEDTDHHGGGRLLAADVQAKRIAAVKHAAREEGVDIVVNARVDVFRGHVKQSTELVSEATRRAQLYVDAGADCVYPITLDREELIDAFVSAVSAPVNILLRGPLTVSRLAALGVKRISVGSGLFKEAYAAADNHVSTLWTARPTNAEPSPE